MVPGNGTDRLWGDAHGDGELSVSVGYGLDEFIDINGAPVGAADGEGTAFGRQKRHPTTQCVCLY